MDQDRQAGGRPSWRRSRVVRATLAIIGLTAASIGASAAVANADAASRRQAWCEANAATIEAGGGSSWAQARYARICVTEPTLEPTATTAVEPEAEPTTTAVTEPEPTAATIEDPPVAQLGVRW